MVNEYKIKVSKKNRGKEGRNEDKKEITFPQKVNVSVRGKFTAG
jgi:hypothetical protein